MSLDSVQIAALYMALQRSEAGVVAVNQANIPLQLLSLLSGIQGGHSSISFIAADDVTDSNLLRAIAECDFTQERIICEGKQAGVYKLEGIKRYLENIQSPQRQ
jgi:hypothetical protein